MISMSFWTHAASSAVRKPLLPTETYCASETQGKYLPKGKRKLTRTIQILLK